MARRPIARRLRRGLVLAALAALGATAPAAAVPVISTTAGTGSSGPASGDGGPAWAATVDGPRGVAWMPDGGYVIAEFFNNRVRRVFPDGRITTLAGNGNAGASGDGGPATSAELWGPHGVAPMPDGDVVIADNRNSRIRHVSLTSGIITTVAGTGDAGFAGDEGLATAAKIDNPRGVATALDGSILIADTGNDRIRRVAPDGKITTVAGDGDGVGDGDGGLATVASLARPFSVAPVNADGTAFLLTQDPGGTDDDNSVRYVAPGGTIRTVAGGGDPAQGNGDGGAATGARLTSPHAVVPTLGGPWPAGGFLVAENAENDTTGGNRVRFVSSYTSQGAISTVAGTGAAGSGGDGGPASAGQLNGPRGLSVGPGGSVLIAEFGPPFTDLSKPPGGDRIRLVREPATAPPAIAKLVPPARLRVKVAKRFRVRYRRRIYIRFTLSAAASVRAEVFRRSRRLAITKVKGRKGANRIRIRKRLKPGRYLLRLSARGADRRLLRYRARLTVVR